ncbi:YhcH/YjgK/YiaL family protein [Urechidicola vernalis]|uniref:YhcH/YjgK/YiaL family protein n=1 Tax=Urechidicola vernalis TaxID=3075600 RepID=A0ABU2Y8N2_9FLAO|nr:YhcH/YjgK/YiaL family protein [Urechidicola sp. P050]MDT0554024.1 YhcH/YjgK/YiaL family protein [Urechidicola sp. P050]
MIIDKLENIDLYKSISNNLTGALEFLKIMDLSSLALGKTIVDLNEETVFAIVSDYETKEIDESIRLEAHRKYIDIQLVLSGSEEIGFVSKFDQIASKPYDSENDYELFHEEFKTVILKAGLFCILFPDDLHAPGLIHEKSETVRKIVIKVKI